MGETAVPLLLRIRNRILRFAALFAPKREDAAADGDDALAAHVLNTYGDMLYRLAYSYVHCREDAEELLQDTVLRLLEKRPAFSSEEHCKAWLIRVCSNLSKDRIRYNGRRKTDELEENLAAEGREDLNFVWDAVKKLPDKYAEVIHLYYYEGYATAEIAEILQKKESTVRSNLRRARIQLRDVLGEAYDFE